MPAATTRPKHQDGSIITFSLLDPKVTPPATRPEIAFARFDKHLQRLAIGNGIAVKYSQVAI